MSESKLMHAQDWIKCTNCFYFRMAPTGQDVTQSVPYCSRRGRQMGWNPQLFMCAEFGAKDDQEAIQTSLDWRWGARA